MMDVTNCICASLRKASRVVSQAYDEALKPSGLNNSQFTLLAALSKTGEIPLTRLAEVMVVDRTTLTRNLQPLIRRGLVSDRAGDDQRVRSIAMTGTGKTVYESAVPLWHGVQARIAGGMGADAWPDFLKSLQSTVLLAQGN
jgi:DNA-binding MarR family transcriptional regulator